MQRSCRLTACSPFAWLAPHSFTPNRRFPTAKPIEKAVFASLPHYFSCSIFIIMRASIRRKGLIAFAPLRLIRIMNKYSQDCALLKASAPRLSSFACANHSRKAPLYCALGKGWRNPPPHPRRGQGVRSASHAPLHVPPCPLLPCAPQRGAPLKMVEQKRIFIKTRLSARFL